MGYGNGFTRGLNARVHSAFFSTGEKNASLAPCALAGYPLALTVCGWRMCAVVTTESAYPASPRLRRGKPALAVIPRQRHFIFHLSSLITRVSDKKTVCPAGQTVIRPIMPVRDR